MPSRVEPSGPIINPVKKSASRIMVTHAKIFIEQPQPMFIVLFQSPALFLLFLFQVEAAKHTVKTVESNHCTYAKSNKSIQGVGVKSLWAVKPVTNAGWYYKA